MSELLDYWPVLAFGFNLVLGWIMWTADRKYASKDELAEIDLRLSKTETRMKDMPTRDDVGRLHVAIAGIAGEIKETNAELRGVGRLVERVESAVTRHEQIFSDAARRVK